MSGGLRTSVGRGLRGSALVLWAVLAAGRSFAQEPGSSAKEGVGEAGDAPASEQAGSRAVVCFRRPFGGGAWAVPLTVRQDGTLLGQLAVGDQRCLDVSAQRHEFGALYWARAERGSTRPAATRVVELQPGECRHFKVLMGFWGVVLRETDASRFKPPATCDDGGS